MAQEGRLVPLRDALVPVAFGMVSALGTGVVSSCAAARAGISRASSFPWPTQSSEDGQEVPLLAHSARGLTEGFEGMARLLRLAELGLRALIDEVGGRHDVELPLYVSLPSPLRVTGGVELLEDPGEREAMRARQPSAEEATESMAELRATIERAWSLVAGKPPDLRYLTTSGHTGFAECLADLAASGAEAAVVAGVDSLLAAETLEWLEATGRLKTAAEPVGLMPGEAAVFVLVQRESAARRRGNQTKARISAIGTAPESGSLLEGKPSQAAGLAEAVLRVRTALGESGRSAWYVSDRNGENHRAAEWGTLLTRLLGRGVDVEGLREIIPALSFGDTGAASGALALAVATRAFERGYAPSPLALLLSSSEGRSRAAVAVSTS